ncbi:hypothetical protein HMI54_008712 [Coelomomyces lativittatus]|nr:hypothetical protein HMI56_004082 [Coelomomyces lativittatus]KAJ1502745.1 hypothetical protein HMI54_008712 [Coelomomyces lativittatus]
MGARHSKEPISSTEPFEKALAGYDARIRKCQGCLTELKWKEKKRVASWTLYSLGGWGVWLLIVFLTNWTEVVLEKATWTTSFPFVLEWIHHPHALDTSSHPPVDPTSSPVHALPPPSSSSSSSSPLRLWLASRVSILFLRWASVILAPLMIYKVRHLISWYYARKRTEVEEELNTLKEKQKQKLEELKDMTEFYKAKQLIERYEGSMMQLDSAESLSTLPTTTPSLPTSTFLPPSVTSTLTSQDSTHFLPPSSTSFMSTFPKENEMHTTSTLTRPTPSALPTDQEHPSVFHFFNQLLDRIVVGNENPPSSSSFPSSSSSKVEVPPFPPMTTHQYALICSHCYHHNGLALPEEFMHLVYRCRHCQTLNGHGGHRTHPPFSTSLSTLSTKSTEFMSSSPKENNEPTLPMTPHEILLPTNPLPPPPPSPTSTSPIMPLSMKKMKTSTSYTSMNEEEKEEEEEGVVVNPSSPSHPNETLKTKPRTMDMNDDPPPPPEPMIVQPTSSSSSSSSSSPPIPSLSLQHSTP